MGIKVTNVVVNVGAGVLDTVLERNDADNARVELSKKYQTWERIGLTVVGYAGLVFNKMTNIADPLAQSGTTLLSKTLLDAVWKPAATASRVTTVSRPRVPVGGPIRRTYDEELSGVGVI